MESFEGCRNGFSNKDVATKYGAPRKTLSTWVKNKHKLTASLKKKKEWTLHEKICLAGTTKRKIKQYTTGNDIRSLSLKIETFLKKGTNRGLETEPFDWFLSISKLDCKVYKFFVW